MTYSNDEINEKFKLLDERLIALADENKVLKHRLDCQAEWLQHIDDQQPKNRTYVLTFPLVYKRVKAQLLYNPPNTSGQHGGNHPPTYQLKLEFFTADVVETIYCPMHAPDKCIAKNANSVYGINVGGDCDLLGCASKKGRRKKSDGQDAPDPKGTITHEGNVATLYWDKSDADYPDHTLHLRNREWGPNKWLTMRKPWIKGEGRSAKEPIAKWTWEPDQSTEVE